MGKEKLNTGVAVYLPIFMCLYCVFTVVQNLFEMKSIGTAEFVLMGGGTIVSWIPFMCGDIITEVYGKKNSIKTFTLAGTLNLWVVTLAQLVIFMPGSYPEQNAAFAQIFSNGLRSALASFIAFWIGNYINTVVMVRMKLEADFKHNDNRIRFFFRAVVSTLLGQFLDNFIFLMIAFAPIGLSVFEMPIKDILSVTFTGTLLETCIESVLVPFLTIPISNKLKSMK